MTDGDQPPVVVGVDGSAAGAGAVCWAADEAARRGRPLRIVHAAEFDDRDARRLATGAAAEARRWQPQLPIDACVRVGTPARVLLEQSRRATLIVAGGRGAGGFPALLLGSVSFHLAAYASCPVLVVHHAERWSRPGAEPLARGTIVVGFDGSVQACHALEMAFQEAATRNLVVRAVHVRHQGGRDAGAAEADEIALVALAVELDAARARYPRVLAEARTPSGRPADGILAEARDAGMIVVGASGRGGFAHLRLGSTAGQVLEYADVPVLLARP